MNIKLTEIEKRLLKKLAITLVSVSAVTFSVSIAMKESLYAVLCNTVLSMMITHIITFVFYSYKYKNRLPRRTKLILLFPYNIIYFIAFLVFSGPLLFVLVLLLLIFIITLK